MSYGGYQPPSPVRAPEPDWNALADRHEQESRRNRLRLIGAVGGAFLLGAVAGGAGMKAVDGSGGKSVAVASASGSAQASDSASASASPPDAGAAAQLADADGTVPLTPAGGTQVKPGNGSKVLWLDGAGDAYAAAPGPVVDTDRSFTVSSWVLLKRGDGAAMAVTQGDGGYYTFALGRDYWPGHHGWVFKVQTAAGNNDNTTYAVFSKGEAPLNTWVHLTGSYDAATHTIALYVGGKLAQQVHVSGIWHNAGALQVGRVRYKGQWGDNWEGALAHIQIWNQALTPAQEAAAVQDKQGVASAHSWLVS